jgi:transposase-like protein
MHIDRYVAIGWIWLQTSGNAAYVAREKLLSTGDAARELGVDRTTLLRWWQHGKVAPEYVTPGNHARWDMETLRRQLREQRPRDK